MRKSEESKGRMDISKNDEIEEQLAGMMESPLMQYLLMNVFNSWAVDEENWKTVWNSPKYTQLALISDLTMQGIL